MDADLSPRRAKVWLLYLKHTRGDRGRLSLNILREVCAFLHPTNLLVRVTKSSIQSFDFQRGTWKQPLALNPHIQTSAGTSWALLEGGRVFICGGSV